MSISSPGFFPFVKNNTILFRSLLPKVTFRRSRLAAKRCFSSDPPSWAASLVESFASLLCSCEDFRSLKKYHACILTFGLGDNIFLGSKLVNCYASFDSLLDSKHVFRRIANRNPSLWTSAVFGYFRSAHFGEVCLLYLRLKLHGVGIESGALNFALKSCGILGDASFGRGLHGDALKVNLNRDKYVGSSLVVFYSQSGDARDAQKAFDEILEKDVVAYTTMVTACAQLVDCGALRAFDVVTEMQKRGLDPNRVTLVSLVQAATQGRAYGEGRAIHCYALRRGIGLADEVLETCLMDMYLKYGEKNFAMSIFAKMERKSVASWNAMIAGLVRLGHSSEALRVYDLMKQEQSVYPDEITFANLLMACNELKCLLPATSVHAYIIRREIFLDLVLTTALIDTYSQCRKIKKARALFDQLSKRDVVCYNVMISGYLQNGLVEEAILLIGKMVEEGIPPNSATIITLLSESGRLANIRAGRCIHGYLQRHGFDATVEILNQLIHMYARCNCIMISRKIFNRMSSRDLVSWTSMIKSYVDSGQADEAFVLFQLMQNAKEKPDPVTLTSLLQAFCHINCLGGVKQIHGFIYRNNLNWDITLLNSLIMTYAKCGKLDTGDVVFNCILEKVLASWNTMIAAYGMHGRCHEAIGLLHQMQKENVKPDGATFTSLLSACSHAGWVEDGWHIFHSMKARYLVVPNEEHYACMVDLLARAGHLEEAFDLIKQSPLETNVSALSSLLSACGVHGNTELGELVGRKLVELDPQHYGSYTLLSNICMHAGNWSKAAAFRDMAKDTGLTKTPAYSLTEVKK